MKPNQTKKTFNSSERHYTTLAQIEEASETELRLQDAKVQASASTQKQPHRHPHPIPSLKKVFYSFL